MLPYWGGNRERKTLRKYLNSNNLYTRNSPFHVLITSYQLVVVDEKAFKNIKWQYMILDEAQAIKNINSQRWKFLLSYQCRNRLLLTGTPIQNSMAELWALLHFIMPKLFDSHEHFQEWFSKDIEAHSQEKGELNQEQLRRLHTILKPFMLRRVKKDVENEIGKKTEYEILCDMTERQKILYNTIKGKLTNITDLFTSVDSKTRVENLMNLVMQFRKVCNHPELFERHIGKVPLVFRNLRFSRTATFIRANNITEVWTDSANCIKFNLPKLVFDHAYSLFENLSLNSEKIGKCWNLFSYSNIINSIKAHHKIKSSKSEKNIEFSGLFSFIGLFNFSINEFINLLKMDSFLAQLCLMHYLRERSIKNNYYSMYKHHDKHSISPFSRFNSNEHRITFGKYEHHHNTEDSQKLEPLSIFISNKHSIEEHSFLFKKQVFSNLPLIHENIISVKDFLVIKEIKVIILISAKYKI